MHGYYGVAKGTIRIALPPPPEDFDFSDPFEKQACDTSLHGDIVVADGIRIWLPYCRGQLEDPESLPHMGIQPNADAGGMAAIDVCTIRMWTPVDIDGVFGVAVPTRHFFFAMTMGSWFQQMLEKSARPTHTRGHSSGAAILVGNLMDFLA